MSSRNYDKIENFANLRRNIKNLLRARKIKQREFAKDVRLTEAYLSEILKGKKTPGAAVVTLMALRLKVPEAALHRAGAIGESGEIDLSPEEAKRAELSAYAETLRAELLDEVLHYIRYREQRK